MWLRRASKSAYVDLCCLDVAGLAQYRVDISTEAGVDTVGECARPPLGRRPVSLLSCDFRLSCGCSARGSYILWCRSSHLSALCITARAWSAVCSTLWAWVPLWWRESDRFWLFLGAGPKVGPRVNNAAPLYIHR